jgi:uncharacterized lipoprotein YajG
MQNHAVSDSTTNRNMKRSYCWLPFIALLLCMAGCGTFTVPVNYVPPATAQADIGNGKALHLHVVDSRSQTGVVGRTADVYKQRIETERPVRASVEEALRLALSGANYLLSDSAELNYEVSILRFEAVWASEFFSKFNTTVDLQVRVLRNGSVLGSKVFRQTGQAPNKLSSDKEKVAAGLLSATMSDAVRRVVADPALTALIRNGDSTIRFAGNRATASAPTPTGQSPQSASESEAEWRMGIDKELEERIWNQALLKNTLDAYLEYFKAYTNTSRMKVLTGTLTTEMSMDFAFGTGTGGSGVKKIVLSLQNHPGFRQEVSVQDAALWKIINYEPLGNNAAKIGTKDPIPDAKVVLVRQGGPTTSTKQEFKVVGVITRETDSQLSPNRLPIEATTQEGIETVKFSTRERTLELRMDALPLNPEISWLNPRTGEKSPAVAVISGETARFPTPQEGEWTLIAKGQKRLPISAGGAQVPPKAGSESSIKVDPDIASRDIPKPPFDSFRLTIVGEKGEALWMFPSQPNAAELKVEIECALYDFDTAPKVRGLMGAALKPDVDPLTTEFAAEYYEESRERIGKALKERTLPEFGAWMLRPAHNGDHVEIKAGHLASTKGTLKFNFEAPVRLRFADTGTFVVNLDPQDKKPQLAEFQFVVCPQTNSPYLSLHVWAGSVSSSAPTGGLRGTSADVTPLNALITGKAAFPEDKWVLLKKGLAVRRGALEFRSDGLFLAPETIVARADRL